MVSPKVKGKLEFKAPPPADFSRFSDWLRTICEEQFGMQRRIAKALDVRAATVNYWIHGRKKGRQHVEIQPGREAVEHIARLFNVSKTALLAIAGYSDLTPRQANRLDPAAQSAPLSPTMESHVEMAQMLDQWQRMHGSDEHSAVRRAIVEAMRAANQTLSDARQLDGERLVLQAIADGLRAATTLALAMPGVIDDDRDRLPKQA